MNLSDVICTSKDGDRFWKLPTCYIRGSAIKYLRLPPQLLEKAREEGADQERQG
jgi:U6 snRNA-associated Sm-like protein LSm4